MPSSLTYLAAPNGQLRLYRAATNRDEMDSAYPHDLIATGFDGKIHPSFLPHTYNSVMFDLVSPALEQIEQGDWICAQQQSIAGGGQSFAVRKALPSDLDRQVAGFAAITTTVESPDPVQIKTRGINTIPRRVLDGFTTADIGKQVYVTELAPGRCTVNPTGAKYIHPVGFIVEVTDAYVRVKADIGSLYRVMF